MRRPKRRKARVNYLLPILRAMRPGQWVKNTLVFAGIVFSKRLGDPLAEVLSLGTFALFCLLAGAIYLYNDVRDAEKDRAHPIKRHRPIASGALPAPVALAAAFVAAALALAGGVAVVTLSPETSPHLVTVLVAYLVLQVAYSLRLKHVVILDVMAIAAGFVLRMLAGGAALSVYPSVWVILCTTLLALFLGFGKRRHEILEMQDRAGETRAILREYSPTFLDQMISVVTASTVVAYSLYTMDEQVVARLGTRHLNLTIPFVLFAVFRYLYLVHQKETGGNPTRTLLTDVPILVDIALWFVAVNLILYL
jgi:4-hydroxybenzoate polyprenyltransferase